MPEPEQMKESATVESPSESSPDSLASEQTANVDEKPINQEAVNKRFNKLAEEKWTERNRANAAEKELAALKAKQTQPVPVEVIPVETPQSTIEPPNDDLLYENPEEYQKQNADYQRSIVKEAIAEERASTLTAERLQTETDRINQRNAESQKAIFENATTHNLDHAELDKSAGVLMQRGMNAELLEIAFKHESGAPLLNHLAQNPADFDEINSLTNPLSIVRALDKIQAKALQRNISGAPDPVTQLNGLGAREGDDFDKRCPGAVIK